MDDDHHNSTVAILTDIRRARAEPSRAWVPSRAPEPSRIQDLARVAEPARLSEPTRQVDYRWEAMRSLF